MKLVFAGLAIEGYFESRCCDTGCSSYSSREIEAIKILKLEKLCFTRKNYDFHENQVNLG